MPYYKYTEDNLYQMEYVQISKKDYLAPTKEKIRETNKFDLDIELYAAISFIDRFEIIDTKYEDKWLKSYYGLLNYIKSESFCREGSLEETILARKLDILEALFEDLEVVKGNYAFFRSTKNGIRIAVPKEAVELEQKRFAQDFNAYLLEALA